MYLALKIVAAVLILLETSQDPGQALYQKAREDFYRLKKGVLSAEELARLGEEFAKVQDKAPGSPKADDALYMAGTLYLDAFDRSGREKYLKKSIKYLEKLWKLYPESRYADDALYFLGEINRARLNRTADSLKYYRLITERYQSGDQYRQAVYWLRHLHVSKKVTLGSGEIKVWSYPSYARVMIKPGSRVLYFYSRLPGGKKGVKSRIYVDLEPAVLAGSTVPLYEGKGLVKDVRAAQFKKDRVRVVLDIGEEIAEYRVFHFDDPFRVIVDVFSNENEEDSIAGLLESLAEERQEKEALTKPSREKNVPQKTPGKPALIVIDPGHGGKDPGAIGRYGTKEKNVTLRLAKLVKEKLEKKGLKVVLTRTKDVFIPLEERTAIANSLKADLFVSIHANASRKRSVRGIEVYYFEKTSDRDVLRLAAQENNLKSFEQLSEVQYILFDMASRFKARFSAVLADFIMKETFNHVVRLARTRNLGSKPGPFYVLKNATMPSVLVETSFISNPREEKLLRDARYISTIAEGISRGIIKFLKHQKKISI